MSRICFICISLGAGGTEKVVSALANRLSKKHEVDVVLLSNREPFYALDDNVGLWQYSGHRAATGRVRYYLQVGRFVRTTLREIAPDVVLSFGELISPFVQMALIGTSLPVCVFNQGAPHRSMSGVSGWLNPVTYPFADRVVLQTGQSLKVLETRYKWCNFSVIPNPLELPDSPPAIEDRAKVVVNVGSMGRLKNQEFLLRSFARVAPESGWELHFVGDGPDRARLERTAETIGIGSRVKFLGERNDVPDILSDAQVFAFSSLSEGLPNALAEALAYGCACISFDCPTGPSELIMDKDSGFLVPMGEDELYDHLLDRLLTDEVLRRRFSKHAMENMRRFSFEKIELEFEELVESVQS